MKKYLIYFLSIFIISCSIQKPDATVSIDVYKIINDCYIGNGVVLSAAKLFEEIEGLEKAGVEVRSRLRVSEACPLILPFHVALDVAREAAREQGGTEKIGTTGRGIGPAYEDKIARRALRVQDLNYPERFSGQRLCSRPLCVHDGAGAA